MAQLVHDARGLVASEPVLAARKHSLNWVEIRGARDVEDELNVMVGAVGRHSLGLMNLEIVREDSDRSILHLLAQVLEEPDELLSVDALLELLMVQDAVLVRDACTDSDCAEAVGILVVRDVLVPVAVLNLHQSLLREHNLVEVDHQASLCVAPVHCHTQSVGKTLVPVLLLEGPLLVRRDHLAGDASPLVDGVHLTAGDVASLVPLVEELRPAVEGLAHHLLEGGLVGEPVDRLLLQLPDEGPPGVVLLCEADGGLLTLRIGFVADHEVHLAHVVHFGAADVEQLADLLARRVGALLGSRMSGAVACIEDEV